MLLTSKRRLYVEKCSMSILNGTFRSLKIWVKERLSIPLRRFLLETIA